MTVSNIQGKMVASHNGDGYWTVFDQSNGELLFNIVPVGFTGDLGVFAEISTFTTVEARDLIRVATVAVDGVFAGGWGEGKPAAQLAAQAETKDVQISRNVWLRCDAHPVGQGCTVHAVCLGGVPAVPGSLEEAADVALSLGFTTVVLLRPDGTEGTITLHQSKQPMGS